MAPTADSFAEGSPQNPQQEPDPQKTSLSKALGAAAEAGKQEYDEGTQGEIAADDAGGTRMAESADRSLERERKESLPKPPPDEASG